ncbi:hypothetical protein Btru_039936 [Bulinus truncatus]|nr:hypothetical protein Btru_039936 [Bulinus truncatus]
MVGERSIDVYLDDSPLLQYALVKYDKDCRIRFAGKGFGADGYAFGLSRHSWLKRADLSAHHLIRQLTISSVSSPSHPSAHHLIRQLTISSVSSPSHPSAHHLIRQLTISSVSSPSHPSAHHLIRQLTISSVSSPSHPSAHHLIRQLTISSHLY